MATFPLRIVKGAALLLIFQLASFSIFSQTRPPSKYRFLIPEGYVGWIRVDFDVAGAPSLPEEDGSYIFKFSESGRLQTSSADVVDDRNEFFYYSANAKYRLHQGGPLEKRLIQEEMSGPGPGHPYPVPNHYRYFFIGPSNVWQKYQASDTSQLPREVDGPKVGPQSWLTREELIQMKVREP